MKKLFPLIIAVAFFASCSPETSSNQLVINAEYVKEGPLFSGGEMAQYLYNSGYGELASKEGFSKDKVETVVLKKATITAGGENLDAYGSFTLEMQSNAEGVGMKTVATVNNLATGQTQVELQLAEDVDASEYFKNGDINFVLNMGLKEDQDEDAKVKATYTFDVQVAK